MHTDSDNNAELYQHLIEEIKDYAIFMLTLDGKFATWNPGVKRVLGYDEHEFIGKDFSTIFNAEDVTLKIPENELKVAKSVGKAEDERWHKRKEGGLFWASGLVTLMKAPDGTPQGFSKIMRDRTEKKKFEEELKAQATSLAIANKELVNFAGVLSHDLNAPLQTVYGFANILKEPHISKAEVTESIDYIVNGTKRMIDLVNELLQYTTLDKESAGRLTLVDMNEVVQNVLLDLTATIKSRRATISSEDLPSIWTDATQVRRVIQNLIENALKYSSPERDPRVKITAHSDTNKTFFSIEDNGRGIDEKESAQLFTLFERLHASSDIPGKGIGLATCRKILERLGGHIWVSSKLNQGSVFSFSLPNLRRDMHENKPALKWTGARDDMVQQDLEVSRA